MKESAARPEEKASRRSAIAIPRTMSLLVSSYHLQPRPRGWRGMTMAATKERGRHDTSTPSKQVKLHSLGADGAPVHPSALLSFPLEDNNKEEEEGEPPITGNLPSRLGRREARRPGNWCPLSSEWTVASSHTPTRDGNTKRCGSWKVAAG
ncbi:hypothetical protein BO94DRAFT_547194 [Aspergillus sclerotioniger CBS 115572]|uniref:Uncharacterized protein n=1 Tax=Aspergillus sclerotioniger CBS 115572 TaxID=1450535 RepID=A0A317WDR3_9EURO|nr:hypothetical protein BO94DRAFT_547194 [Aspergillus sclerotioniger CBS 115572]PWY84606.1 hypothetical protein BO94DRAFT_547194 [Aspergillus sclerotioniger CBS 115572]